MFVCTLCAVGIWFSFGGVLNSIGQCGVRLIARRFNFGAQEGIDCGTEQR